MSDIRARFVGHPGGVTLTVPVGTEGETRHITIPHGGELPHKIDGLAVPAAFRDSLLEQPDNWTEVRRDAPKKTTSAAEADEKEA